MLVDMSQELPTTPGRAPRRTPTAAERQRDPDRTRERLFAAAAAEFGAKGFAGARVSAIAARAGVNQQLIAYYFGGKQGLYDELLRRWHSIEMGIATPERPFADVVHGFLQAAADNPDWTRLLAWQNLAGGPGGGPADQEHADLRAAIAELRARQARGEIAADLDPALVLVVLYAVTTAPVLLGEIVREACADDPTSAAVLDRLAGLLVRLLQPPARDGGQESATSSE
jgi:AcrR family transcriptional regulator